MTEQNEQILQQFFAEAARQEVADGDFSSQVMERIDRMPCPTPRSAVLCRAWTWLCVAIGALLFWLLGGVEASLTALHTLIIGLASSLQVWLLTLSTADVSLSPLTLLLLIAFGAFYLPFITVRRLFSDYWA